MGLTRRAPSLEHAHDVRGACRAVAGDLAARPGLLPSVYLEHGGRLRCQAVHGYWQTRDGIPPTSGIIGKAFRTGRRSSSRTPATARTTWRRSPASPPSWPCRCAAAGGWWAWSTSRAGRPLSARGARWHPRGSAAALGRRIAELGGPPGESDAQRLVRHATAMAALEEPDEIVAGLLTSALDVVALDSAMLLTVDAVGALRVRAATGPLAGVLRGPTTRPSAAVVDWVPAGASSFTAGAARRRGPARAGRPARGRGGVLRRAACRRARQLRRACWSWPGASHVVLSTDRVELLELLAAHVSSCLRTAEALRACASAPPRTR